jgi:hypothetical protein
MRVKRCAADQGGFGFKLEVEDVQDLDRFGHDFWADAITGKDCDFHVLFL